MPRAKSLKLALACWIDGTKQTLQSPLQFCVRIRNGSRFLRAAPIRANPAFGRRQGRNPSFRVKRTRNSTRIVRRVVTGRGFLPALLPKAAVCLIEPREEKRRTVPDSHAEFATAIAALLGPSIQQASG